MSKPTGLAVIIGAGPNTGTGIARIFSDPSQGDLAVALLARSQSNLDSVKSTVLSSSSHTSAIIETFTADTSSTQLRAAFESIRKHKSFEGLKLKVAVYSIKHAEKKPFMEETYEKFTDSLTAYVGGAMLFAQESLRLLFEHHGDAALSVEKPEKKGTIIFTGTLGAMRTNAEYASYGAGRAGVRSLAQALGKEFSVKGVHVVHIIANGGIRDEEEGKEGVREGKKMSADAVGRTYLMLAEQGIDLWTQELDMRPAQEKW